MLSWSDEISQMLAAFEQQTKFSLSNIKMAFKHNGLSFNAQFKQYFLQVSNTRIKETYDQFEIKSMLEDQVFGAHASSSATDDYQMFSSIYTPSYDRNNTRQETNSPVEIIDTSDEEEQALNKVKMEIMEELSTARYNYHGVSLSDVDQLAGEAEIDDVLKADRSSLNNGPNFIDHANGNNTPGTSKQSARKWTASNFKSNGKQLEMKKRFKCELCEYSCEYNCTLNRHMRTHTGEKPFRCDICRKGFTRTEYLKKHQVIHINEFPFHCRACFTGFFQKADKEAHEKVCKKRRYECHICKKCVTLNKTDLKLHMRKHNGEKPFRCEICMMRFTRKGSLNTHLNTIHTRINPQI